MTGEEFLIRVRAIKTITDISWHVEGEVLDPDLVKVTVVADEEKLEVTYPNPYDNSFDPLNLYVQYVAICLLINKLMVQLGDNYRICATDNMTNGINYAKKLMKSC